MKSNLRPDHNNLELFKNKNIIIVFTMMLFFKMADLNIIIRALLWYKCPISIARSNVAFL